MSEWLAFVAERLPALGLRTGEHIVLTGVSTLAAIALGLPLGIAASRLPHLRGVILALVGVLQTIPSLAMLAFLLTLLNRIGALPAVLALVLYALLPIVRNTLAGLAGVAPAVREAADGIGMTPRQRLWWVELPLAAPVIVAGIRTAAVVGVGIATLSAFIGAGGLGQFINRGLALSNHQLILLGAVPAALLALLVDAAIAAAQWGAGWRRAGRASASAALRVAAIAAPVLMLGLAVLLVARSGSRWPPGAGSAGERAGVVRIGTKNFTEQVLLGELMAQLLERETELRVERRFDLGGTMICHAALVEGQIDLYAEYTGTALTAVLGRPVITDPDAAYRAVAEAYARQFDVRWLEPFGFENGYALAIRADDARRWGIATVSELAARADRLRAGWAAEFSERPDGYPGLRTTYGLAFAQVRDLDPSLMYAAIARGQVDVISAFTTDGRIASHDLVTLRDDRRFFPPYSAAPVVREVLLDRHPEVAAVLERLAGRLDTGGMRRLNAEVDEGGRSPASVARSFLDRELEGGRP